MEKVKVTPEDLQSKFKSKEDLYDLLSLDRKIFIVYALVQYHLPPDEKWPIHFLLEVLSGDKQVWKSFKFLGYKERSSQAFRGVPIQRTLSCQHVVSSKRDSLINVVLPNVSIKPASWSRLHVFDFSNTSFRWTPQNDTKLKKE